MIRRLLVGACLMAAGAPLGAQSSPAAAVADAKARGLVGERYDGYVGLVVDGGAMLRHQVQAINIRRRSIYSRFATAKGVNLQEVGITAGCQLLGTVGVGEQYLGTDNRWRRRGPGQGAPTPDYCR